MVDYDKYGENTGPAPSQAPQGGVRRSGSRLWMGCCGGCAGAVLLIAVSIAVGIYFLLRVQPVMPPEVFFLPEANGFIVVRIDPDDDGLVGLIQSLAENPPPALNLSEEEKANLREKAGDIPRRIKRWTPINIVSLIYLLEEPEELKHKHFEAAGRNGGVPKFAERMIDVQGEKRRFSKAVAASTRRAGGLLRLLVRGLIEDMVEQGGRKHSHGNVRIGTSPEGLALGALDNNVLLAERRGVVHEWIDALRATKPGAELSYNGPPGLENIYGRIRLPAPFYFAVSNRSGEVSALVESFLEIYEIQKQELKNKNEVMEWVTFIAENLDAVSGSLRILEAGGALVDIYAECRSKEDARDIGAMLVLVIQYFVEEDAGLKIEVDVDGAVAHVSILKDDLTEALREL